MYYYVKWVGWPHAFCTWEPEDNFMCSEMIDEYKAKKESRGGKPMVIVSLLHAYLYISHITRPLFCSYS